MKNERKRGGEGRDGDWKKQGRGGGAIFFYFKAVTNYAPCLWSLTVNIKAA